MPKPPRPILVAVAGPKGGVGKSLISANLAVGLAQRGFKTVLADLDLGGANLQAFLGQAVSGPGLADFVFQKRPLAELLRPTEVENLAFLTGPTDNTLGLANLIQWQKLKLLTQLKKLPAQVVVADLGAGSAFNTLDLYAEAAIGLMVITPEMTSLLKSYGFLKSLMFRVFLRILKAGGHRSAFDLVEETARKQNLSGFRSLAELTARVASLDRAAAEKLKQAPAALAPGLVLNMAAGSIDRRSAEALSVLARKRLGLALTLWAEVPLDQAARQSIAAMRPLLLFKPQAPAARALDGLAARLSQGLVTQAGPN